DQIEAVGDCAYKVLAQMEKEAAQGELIFHDDTGVRILALMQENRALVSAAQAYGLSTPQERTGMHTTARVVKVGAHTAILYYSSRRGTGSVSCNSVFVLYLCRFLNQEELMKRETMGQNS